LHVRAPEVQGGPGWIRGWIIAKGPVWQPGWNRAGPRAAPIAGVDANLARIGGVGYNIGSMQPLNRSANRRLTTLDGTPASCLGLAAGPKQDPRCVCRAFARGINYFFFYGPGNTSFIDELAALVPQKREQIIVATGSGSRRVAGLRAARRKLAALL